MSRSIAAAITYLEMADPDLACSANYTAFNAASTSQDVALVATGGLLSLVSVSYTHLTLPTILLV